MKVHVKFRNLYKKCAEMIKRIVETKKSIKSEVYKQKDHSIYLPIITKVIQNFEILSNVVEKTKFRPENKYYGIVLCSEILNEKLKNNFWLKIFKEQMGDTKLTHSVKQKFIRINTLKYSADKLKDLKIEPTFIPNVYKLIDSENIVDNKLYSQGKIIVQNISSCLPAFILNPGKNSVCIDSCAAPGNKTSHLASIMENTGKIYAFEVDKNRFDLMKRQLYKFGVKNVEGKYCDFFKVDPDEYKNVDYVLVDPTCTGSGIHEHYSEDKDRCLSLKKFQIKMLKHAFKFNPKKVVYSTCSIHKEEGEEVVKEALIDENYILDDLSAVISSPGYDEFDFNKKVIRFRKDDGGEKSGFFVASFSRKE